MRVGECSVGLSIEHLALRRSRRTVDGQEEEAPRVHKSEALHETNTVAVREIEQRSFA